MRSTFVETLFELAAADPKIMLITGDLGFGVLTDYAERFPRQYLNAGVAEQNMTGIATGLALDGYIVFTYSIANFPTLRCLEQIRNGACYHELSVVNVSVGAGLSYGPLGISHHATEDVTILRSLPNYMVISPCNRWETKGAVRALALRKGPAVLRLDRSSGPETPADQGCFLLGKGRLIREGSDISLVVTGGLLSEALAAAAELQAEGISCRVISFHSIKPLDVEILKQASRETAGIISIEEHTVDGGFGSAVIEALVEENCLPRSFLRIGLRHGFVSAIGSQQYLRTRHKLDSPAIAEAVRMQLQPTGKETRLHVN